ncbi:MAG: RDD family protein [Candidatus Hydrogenedentes bacterium]|nr:RDD family protein [Candidatus Hydrogenedentota bacterium]
MDWYYVAGGERRGPVDREAFRALVREGAVQADTLVWNPDMPDWQPFNRVAPAFLAEGQALVPEVVHCVNCRRIFEPNQVIPFRTVHVCGQCKETFFQRLSQHAARHQDLDYAGFWVRAGAKTLDMLLLASVTYVVYALGMYFIALLLQPDPMYYMALSLALNFIQFLVGLTYATWFVGRFQSTPGKMVCGLRIVMPEGTRITYMRALGRAAAEHISWALAGFGYFMAAWDDERRTLHDNMCDTRVVRDHVLERAQ